MSDDLFAGMTETLSEDNSILSEEYHPDVTVERDNEIDAYRTALNNVLFGRNPANGFIYGKTGVGKTAVTEYIMSALQTEVLRREEADELHPLSKLQRR